MMRILSSDVYIVFFLCMKKTLKLKVSYLTLTSDYTLLKLTIQN